MGSCGPVVATDSRRHAALMQSTSPISNIRNEVLERLTISDPQQAVIGDVARMRNIPWFRGPS